MSDTSRLILAVGVNYGYYFERAIPYATQINERSQIENHFVCVDFLPDPVHQAQFPNIHYSPLSTTQLRAPWDTKSVQHGEFTLAMPGDPDDVILFTDADIQFQRPFDADEIQMMWNLEPGQFVVGYNAGPEDTLWTEGMRLHPMIPMEQIHAKYIAPFPKAPLAYNVGATIARRDTWERMTDLYVERYHEMEQTFGHKARQQWFISYLMVAGGFEILPMPQSMHTHGHYPWPEGTVCREEDGVLLYQDRVVLLKHAIR